MAGLSTQEQNTLKQIDLSKRIAIMADYLLDGRYNMSELGNQYFRGENYSQYVSLITRSYCFHGQNSGKYRPGCTFERKLGRRITAEDIANFVYAYPNGSWYCGVTFESFLLAGMRGEVGTGVPAGNAQGGPVSDSDLENLVTRITGVVWIAATLVCKFGFHFGWILSIILGIVAAAAVLVVVFGRKQ